MEDKETIKLIRRVVFFGGADIKQDSKEFKLAYDTAVLLAQNNYVIVDGGGTGIMLAASMGAKSVKGKTIGVTMNAIGATHFEGRVQDGLLDQEIKTVNYLYRTMRLLKNGDVYLVFKGGTGTLSEFSMAWALARIYYNCHKSLILVGDFWQNIIQSIDTNLILRPEEKKVYEIVQTPQGILECIQEFEHDAMLNGCSTKIHYKDSDGFELEI